MSAEELNEQEVEQIVDQPEEAADQVSEETSQQVDQQVDQIVDQPKPQEGYQAKNFKSLKEAKERAERERDELLRRLQEREKNEVPEENLDVDIAPDDFVEGKHFSKVGRRIKKLEEQVILATTEARLKAKYTDFDEIVSAENIEALKYTYPELAKTIINDPDLYSKGVSAYTMIKKLGLGPTQDYDKEKEIINKNQMKPRPINSIPNQEGSSPLHKANMFAEGLTEDLKKQLYKEMVEARKKY